MTAERVQSLFVVPSGVTLTATNSGGGPTSVPVTAGNYYIDELCAEIAVQLTATRPAFSGDPWAVEVGDDGRVVIECTDGDLWSIAWVSTALRDVVGFTANLTSVTGASTSPNQAKFIWYPQRGLNADTDPKQAPRGDDGRATVNPLGGVYGIVSSARPRKHINVRFEHVEKSRVWAADATLTNADWETFYMDSQRGGHAWGTPFAALKVFWDNGGVATELGNGAVDSWSMPNPTKLDQLRMSVERYTGLVHVVLGDLYSTG